MSNNCQSSGPVGVSDGVTTPKTSEIWSTDEHYWRTSLKRHCETTVCREEREVHKKEMTNSSEVSAHWERAIEPLVLVFRVHVNGVQGLVVVVCSVGVVTVVMSHTLSCCCNCGGSWELLPLPNCRTCDTSCDFGQRGPHTMRHTSHVVFRATVRSTNPSFRMGATTQNLNAIIC